MEVLEKLEASPLNEEVKRKEKELFEAQRIYLRAADRWVKNFTYEHKIDGKIVLDYTAVDSWDIDDAKFLHIMYYDADLGNIGFYDNQTSFDDEEDPYELSFEDLFEEAGFDFDVVSSVLYMVCYELEKLAKQAV